MNEAAAHPRLVRGTVAALGPGGQPAQVALGRRGKSSGELNEKEDDGAALVSERVMVVAVMGVDTADTGGGVPHVRAGTRGDVQNLIEGRRQSVAEAMRVATARNSSGEARGAELIPRLELHNEVEATRALAALSNVKATILVERSRLCRATSI